MFSLLKSLVRQGPASALRDYWRQRRAIRHFWRWSRDDEKRLTFYRQFVQRGDLVFDVGANMGNRAKIFSQLGARVIAVEPQTACADFLSAAYRGHDNFTLVRKALGTTVGTANMLISNDHVISSLSPSWVNAVRSSGRFTHCEWNRTQNVPVDTLDNLIAEFGTPVFIKVDVEGYESNVIAGLSQPVIALSFEFTPEYFDNTALCIDHLCKLGDVAFQISLGESMDFYLQEWVSGPDARTALSEIPAEAFGDVYARFD